MADDAAAAASPRAAGGAPESPFWNLMLPVIGVVGTSIGVIGFVIFFGGFIVWTRFTAEGLPADQAVAQIPRNDLIVTGAGFLVPAMLAALLAVVVTVALWDRLIGDPRRERVRAARRALADRMDEVEQVTAQIAGVKRTIEHVGVDLAGLTAAMERYDRAGREAKPDSPERASARARYDEAEKELLAKQSERSELSELLSRLEEQDMVAGERAVEQARRAVLDARELSSGEKRRQIAVCGAPMLAVELWVILAGASGLDWLILPLLVLAGVTIGVSVVVVSNTDHLAWYALVVFVGVGVVIAATTHLRTRANTKLSPVAAVSAGEPVVGFFVAETADAIYVARPVLKEPARASDRPVLVHGRITLQRLPKDAVTHLTIGQLASEVVAFRRSVELALVLCRHRAVTPAPRADAGVGNGGAQARASGANASNTSVSDARAAADDPPAPRYECTTAARKALRAMRDQIGA